MFGTHSMQKSIIFLFCLFPFFAQAQTDILVLKKRGRHILSYTTGDKLTMETVYRQVFTGKITEMRHDSIFLDGQPWHYKEIANIRRVRMRSGFLMIGTGMMYAGGGFLVLSRWSLSRRPVQRLVYKRRSYNC